MNIVPVLIYADSMYQPSVTDTTPTARAMLPSAHLIHHNRTKMTLLAMACRHAQQQDFVLFFSSACFVPFH